MNSYTRDLIERTAAAYALALVVILIGEDFDFTDFVAWKNAGLAAIPAGLQVIYSALAFFVGSPKTAGLTDPTK